MLTCGPCRPAGRSPAQHPVAPLSAPWPQALPLLPRHVHRPVHLPQRWAGLLGGACKWGLLLHCFVRRHPAPLFRPRLISVACPTAGWAAGWAWLGGLGWADSGARPLYAPARFWVPASMRNLCPSVPPLPPACRARAEGASTPSPLLAPLPLPPSLCRAQDDVEGAQLGHVPPVRLLPGALRVRHPQRPHHPLALRRRHL